MKPSEYLTAFEALTLAKTPPEKERFVRVLDLIRVVAENGKRRAVIALSPEDDEYGIVKALQRLGYDVESDPNNAYSLQISWQYAVEQTSDKADAKTV